MRAAVLALVAGVLAGSGPAAAQVEYVIPMCTPGAGCTLVDGRLSCPVDGACVNLVVGEEEAAARRIDRMMREDPDHGFRVFLRIGGSQGVYLPLSAGDGT